ncbi:hypothetical protein CHS0354_020219, partial [Potamilus streckersoni]
MAFVSLLRLVTYICVVLIKLEDFRLINAYVAFVDGEYRVDAERYLNELAFWASKLALSSDHVMLFTRYQMFDVQPDKRVFGRSYNGFVCDSYYKTSVIKSADYFLTVNVAAHELGHNLGADHDGEDNATACRADDQFIMAPKAPTFNLFEPYSRHPYIFSNCSVKAFKDTLKDKMCLRNVGVPYDNEEWNGIIKTMPGQVYSLDQQCELIKGPGSRFCG